MQVSHISDDLDVSGWREEGGGRASDSQLVSSLTLLTPHLPEQPPLSHIAGLRPGLNTILALAYLQSHTLRASHKYEVLPPSLPSGY